MLLYNLLPAMLLYNLLAGFAITEQKANCVYFIYHGKVHAQRRITGTLLVCGEMCVDVSRMERSETFPWYLN